MIFGFDILSLWMGGFMLALVIAMMLSDELPDQFGDRHCAMVAISALWWVLVVWIIYMVWRDRKG